MSSLVPLINIRLALLLAGIASCKGLISNICACCKICLSMVLLIIVAKEDSEGEQVDIVIAFLYGDLREMVYMMVPAGR